MVPIETTEAVGLGAEEGAGFEVDDDEDVFLVPMSMENMSSFEGAELPLRWNRSSRVSDTE